jgi:biopolymer transport protein TolQ
MEKTISVSLTSLITQADTVVQLVMFFLMLASIWSWSIIFDKILKFQILKKRSDKFEALFENTDLLEDVYIEAKNNDNHPLSRAFVACMKEWKTSNIKQIISDTPEKKSSLKDRLGGAMQISINRSMQKMELGLNFLAIIGSVSPFIGLFGTVWGIMSSFKGIAMSKSASLTVVAPGIAESLLATGIGLFAAIPAVFFYNIFSTKINHFNERAQNFSIGLLNIFSRELDR